MQAERNNSSLPQHAEIVEVGPRDGLQREPVLVAVEQKVALIDALVAAGLKRIQVTSFVHPRLVPQMADAEAVCAALTAYEGVHYSGLVLNLKGIERAHAAKLDDIDMSVSASDAHSRRNANRSVAEALAEFDEMYERARAYGMRVRGGIQCAFGFEAADDVDPATVVEIARHYVEDLGVDELALADSSGMANPQQLQALLRQVQAAAGDTPIVLHLHDTRGMGLANVLAALQLGVNRFDTAFGGLGGCPFIDGATGNIATEDTVHMLQQMGVETGVDTGKVAAISAGMARILEKENLPSKLYGLLAPA